MAGKILVLDEKVISQIAAGEVIEKPASVVKELLENAIDAESNQINIEVEDGGKKSIIVVDDGIGMNREDAEKAFLRHSTSKITTLRDLESINSLGFRGEALASIAAVAKVTLLTKSREYKEDIGTEVLVEGGKIRHVKDAACNYGTTVTVKDLFYNTPARRKYLKSTRAELSRITDNVTRQALINPEIFFRLTHNNSEIINTPSTTIQLDNIVNIYGKEIAREMLAVEYSDLDLKIDGFISKPAVTRKSSSHISIFINKRYIKSKLLSIAIKEGYGNLIMKDRYPVAIISLHIHPRNVDVNVHPTKQEIRFENEKKIYDFFIKAIKHTLQTQSLILEIDNVKLEEKSLEAFDIPLYTVSDITGDAILGLEAKKQSNIDDFKQGMKSHVTVEPSLETKSNLLPKMSLVGQILNTYIIAQSGDKIIIIDQHAAHERVLFERLNMAKKEVKEQSQELLSPMILEFSPKQDSYILENMEILNSLGFKIERFGKNTYQIRAVPVVFRKTVGDKAIYDIIDDLILLGRTKEKEELIEKAMAVVACHSAIRGGEELSLLQMKNLVESLYETRNAYSCPHGRPSILLMSKYELEKKFKRK